MPGDTGMNWDITSVMVEVGGTATATYTGSQPTKERLDALLNGKATAEVSSGVVTFTGVSAGEVRIPAYSLVSSYTYSGNAITISVTAAAEDQNFLNERGLARVWNNIDTLKQDKLTAGTNITIASDNTISAETGWKYLGQARLTAAASSLTFTFPKKYDNYKIMFGGEFDSGSGTWIDLRLLNGTKAIVGGHQVQDVTGTGWAAAAIENVPYHLNSSDCYKYETVNIDFYSLKTSATQWRKFQGHLYKIGNSYTVRTSNGRFMSATEPTAVQIITGGTLAAGATIKVWASNNT